MRTLAKALAVCVILAITGTVCFGCSSGLASNGSAGKSAAHSKEHFEGYWACMSCKKDGVFTNKSSKESATFPYLDFDLEEGQPATINQINSDGSVDTIVMGEWEATDNGVKIGDAELALTGKTLTMQHGDMLLYFNQFPFGDELYGDRIVFDDMVLAAPIDLAYIHEGRSPESSNYYTAISNRKHGPSLTVSITSTEAQDITELADYYLGYEECFTDSKGRNYFVNSDDEKHHSDVDLVANGKWYRIDFDYHADDPVDFSKYAKTMYTTISVGNEPQFDWIYPTTAASADAAA